MLNFEHPLATKIRKQMVATMAQYRLLRDGDRVLVCVSGGKDSSVLLALLTEIQKRAPFQFEIGAVMLDQKQPGFSAEEYQKWVETEIGISLTILEEDTYKIVQEKVTSGAYCSVCSRLRRGILYNYAFQNGFTKMALGHHRDDAAETLLLNLFYSGQLQAMPPKFRSDDERNTIIRPLVEVSEADIQLLSEEWAIPVIPCNLCGSQDGLKRKKMKELLGQLEGDIPDIRRSMATAVTNVRVSHLSDDRVWPFRDL